MNKPLLKLEALALMGRGVVLHGSSVSIAGGAWVFLARSGGGKSTVARKMREGGCGDLGDDVTLIARGTDSLLRAMPCASYIAVGGGRPEACPLERLMLLEFGPLLVVPRLDPGYALYRCLGQNQIMIMRNLGPEQRQAVVSSLSQIIEESGCGLLRFSLDSSPREILDGLLQ